MRSCLNMLICQLKFLSQFVALFSNKARLAQVHTPHSRATISPLLAYLLLFLSGTFFPRASLELLKPSCTGIVEVSGKVSPSVVYGLRSSSVVPAPVADSLLPLSASRTNLSLKVSQTYRVPEVRNDFRTGVPVELANSCKKALLPEQVQS